MDPAQLPRSRRVDLHRLSGGATTGALVALALGALATTAGTVVAGRLAENPHLGLVWALLACVLGGTALDTVGKLLWAGVVDRAEGRLRDDLLDASLAQPLRALSDQAVGEVLDRVDDDTREVGSLLRVPVWRLLRTVLSVLPLWVVGGLTWWPAWILFPALAGLAYLVLRPLLGPIAELKVVEEAAWTDHAAALEEGIAGRDDIRTSLGQAFVVRRLAALSGEVHRRFAAVLRLEVGVIVRTGALLHGLLAVVALAGAFTVHAGRMTVGEVVTLFLVTSSFVGSVGRLAQQLPDLQAGMGAVIRLREMLRAEPEPTGGAALPDGDLDLRFRDLHFSYEQGRFALAGIDLHVPAGRTLALVGRTGSGKSTLASLVSRAVEPQPGTVLLGGVDVRSLYLDELRHAVGVVTQRTEVVAGTLAQNIALFADVPRAQLEGVVAELGLREWVDALPDGLDTVLGPGGTTLSAGEEQLLAFARLLVRDVRVVVLDEATARMDPLTEARVVAAAERLLEHRTGILVAHRLTTIARADLVAVLDGGRLTQAGPQVELARVPGPFRDLLGAAGSQAATDASPAAVALRSDDRSGRAGAPAAVGATRRVREAPERAETPVGSSLARGVREALAVTPRWGALAIGLFLLHALLGADGAVTGLAWGRTVQALGQGTLPVPWLVLTAAAAIAGPLVLAAAVARYPRWWVEVLLRIRMAVLVGQTGQRRLAPDPPGEVVARAMDADRYVRYADRWVDFGNGLAIAVVTAVVAGTPVAGLVLLAVMVASALASAIGRPVAGRSAAVASAARARFGRTLVSVLDSARTVKLAGRTRDVRAHLRSVDAGRVQAAVREHRVQAVLDGVPIGLVQLGAVVAWAAYVQGHWGLATTLLVVNAVNGFDWFGAVAGAVVTEAPGARAWQVATGRMAGGRPLTGLPAGVDLLAGDSPLPDAPPRVPLETLRLAGVDVVHDDGTIGVEDVDLQVDRGQLVLLLGQVGSGKSSLLRSMAGLVDHTGELTWNGRPVEDAETFLRPGQVAYVGQLPRVLSGSFEDNILLGHDRAFDAPVDAARLAPDVEGAGGPHALVGHRGVRLSGGQVQRLALARALAADAELLLADDVSSALDARTEVELWAALRERGTTVVGATSKRAALEQADQVVVLDAGRVVATGQWSALAGRWGHLAG